MPLLLIDTELCEILRLNINQYLIIQQLNKSIEAKRFEKLIDWNDNDIKSLEEKGYIFKAGELKPEYIVNPNIKNMLNNWVDEFTKIYTSYPAYKKTNAGNIIPLKGNRDQCHKEYLRITGSNNELQRGLREITKDYVETEENGTYFKTLLSWLKSIDMSMIIDYVNKNKIPNKKEQIL